jgi:hypothetical protein
VRNELHFGDLGPGWEETTRALAAVQADLARTVPAAPEIVMWSSDSTPAGEHLPQADNRERRWAYVGKADGWHFGAGGGFELPRNYASAVVDVAAELSDAIIDTFLGYYAYWPHCPTDDRPLTVRVDAEQRCWWVCLDGGHTVAPVGQLPAAMTSRPVQQ